MRGFLLAFVIEASIAEFGTPMPDRYISNKPVDPCEKFRKSKARLKTARISSLDQFGISMSLQNFLSLTEKLQREQCKSADLLYTGGTDVVDSWYRPFSSYCNALDDYVSWLDKQNHNIRAGTDEVKTCTRKKEENGENSNRVEHIHAMLASICLLLCYQ